MFTLLRFFVWLRDGFQSIVSPMESLDVSDVPGDSLRVLHRGMEIIITKTDESVRRNGQLVARFSDIRWVEVQRTTTYDDGPDLWKVAFVLTKLTQLVVGATTDDVEASIAGARIATITGKSVRSVA